MHQFDVQQLNSVVAQQKILVSNCHFIQLSIKKLHLKFKTDAADVHERVSLLPEPKNSNNVLCKNPFMIT